MIYRPFLALLRKGLERAGHPAVVFGAAVALRILLAIFNREGNDDHVTVVRMIVDRWHFAEHDECGECFQPKLYHLTAALLIRLLGIDSPAHQIIACQQLNVAAGALTLFLCWRFLRRLPIEEHYRRLTFAVLAFNPGLLAINGQATNDTFVILLGTAAFVLLNRWIHQARGFVALCLVVVASGLTKGNGIIMYLLVVLVGVVVLLQGWWAGSPLADLRRFLLGLAVLSVTFFGLVPFLGPYAHHYRKFGSPFTTNWVRVPPADFFTETVVKTPGITSLAGGYLTFRIVDLLETPTVVSIEPEPHPLHRTSLWSMIYGLGNSVFFARWPPTWVNDSAGVRRLDRAILALALVPLMWLVVGVASTVAGVARRGVLRTAASQPVWVLLWVAAFFAMLVKYTYDYRDYSAMKAIFVFPAILPMMILLATGMASVGSACARRRWGGPVMVVLQGAAVALILCDIAEIGVLIHQLAG